MTTITLRYVPYVFIVAVALVTACGTPLEKQKAELEKLKAEQVKLTSEIRALEAEIAKAEPAKVEKTIEVGVTSLAPGDFQHYVTTQGVVESEHNIVISAKAMGIVTDVLVQEGQTVAKGQVLARLDNSLVLSGMEEVKSQLTLATSVYERQKKLWDQKIGTEVQFLQAKANKEGLENRLASLREQNDMMNIRSLIQGTVDEVRTKVGENIAPGMPAFRVINGNDLKIKMNVSEAYVSKINKGAVAIVTFPELGKTIEAKVDFVGKNIDRLSRTFPVEVSLPSSSELRPNMTATARLVYRIEKGALSVPVNVIQDINGEKVVYVAVQESNKVLARRRTVKVEGVFGNQAQISDGLKAGDNVITTGYQGLNEGELLKI